jgi:single-strand DNA-binding protein
MAGETIITIIGNITADPELRFTPSGAAVANFTVASTPRTFDKNSNEWKDGETLFMRCAVWRDAAENVAESLQRGTRVLVSGRLKSRSYDKEGQKHTVVEMDVDEVGPSLKYATAKVNKTQRGGGGGFNSGGQGGGQGSGQGAGQGAGQGGGSAGGAGGQGAPANDPWATGSPAPANTGGGQPAGPQGGWGNGPTYDEPPF